MTDFLLEIGTEELPYQVIAPALQFLGDASARLLKEHRLSHGSIRTFGTPRRLTVAVEGLTEHQAPSVHEIMGPPNRAAFDAAGHPTKAAEGFAASQGVAVTDLETRQTPKGEYVCAVKRDPGLPARAVLSRLLPELIGTLSFPKTMRWNVTGMRFARPIRWILAVSGSHVIPFEAGGVKAGIRTWGHRFAGASRSEQARGCRITGLSSYQRELERRGVIADQGVRREKIIGQLNRLAESVNGRLDQDEALLEQAVYTVEYPHAILGKFDPSFLALPAEVLKTAMKEHQGYFPLTGPDGALLPCFIAVTNMKLPKMGLIREGNERVLAARLADAQFFFNEDRKLALADRVGTLKAVTFHHKLGTMHQKTGRVMALAAKIADLLGDLDLLETVKRAAQLSKTDLLTGMVGEFPSLQGVMGGDYARLDGEPAAVSAAISEQYLPRAMEGALPETQAGKVLSLADRLDSIVSFFHVGIIPSGSEDPFGLRRHALAVARLLLEGNLKLDLLETLDHAKRNVVTQGFAQEAVPQSGSDRHRPTEPADFILERVRYYGRVVHGLREDVMEAVLKGATDRPLDLAAMLARMQALQRMAQRAEFDPLMIGFTRAHRLTEKEQWDQKEVDPSLFQHAAERELHKVLQDAQVQVPEALRRGDDAKSLEALVGMKPAIDGFFDGVMVNADDPALRANRLSLLQAVDRLFMSVADFSRIMVEGK